MVFRSCRHTLQRAHRSALDIPGTSRTGMRSVLASARRAVAGGAALGLASLVMGCAQQPAGPAVTDLAPATAPQASAPPDTEQVMGAAGPELERELIAFCKEQLAAFKCPRSVDFLEELPRHPTGKLYKRLLRDPYWEGKATRI